MKNTEALTLKEKGKFNIFKKPLVVTLLALLCCALWGSATPAIQVGYEFCIPVPEGEARPFSAILLFAGLRFLFAGVITVVIYSIARRRFIYPKRENLWRVGALSSFQTILQYIFFYLGLSITAGVKGTVISGSSTFFAILIASLILRQEKLSFRKMSGCVIGFAGIIVVNFSALGEIINIGDIFVLLSAVANGFSAGFAKKFSKHEDPVVLSGYQFILGGAILTAVGFISGGRLNLSDPKGALILVYLMFLSAVAYSLWGVLLKFNPVSRVTIFSFATPVFGVILTLIFLPEKNKVNPLLIVASLILVSLGILILNLQLERSAKKAAEVGAGAHAPEALVEEKEAKE